MWINKKVDRSDIESGFNSPFLYLNRSETGKVTFMQTIIPVRQKGSFSIALANNNC